MNKLEELIWNYVMVEKSVNRGSIELLEKKLNELNDGDVGQLSQMNDSDSVVNFDEMPTGANCKNWATKAQSNHHIAPPPSGCKG